MQKKKINLCRFCVPPPPPPPPPPPSALAGGGAQEAPPRSRRTGPAPAPSGGCVSEWEAADGPGGDSPPRPASAPPPPQPQAGGFGGAPSKALVESSGYRERSSGSGERLKGFALPDPGHLARLGRGGRAPGARPRFGGRSPGGRTRWFEKRAEVEDGEREEAPLMEPRRSRESERKGWKAAGALGRLAGPLSRLGRSPGPVFAELRRAPGTGRGSVLPQSLLAAPRAAPVGFPGAPRCRGGAGHVSAEPGGESLAGGTLRFTRGEHLLCPVPG